jgi:hypothetical protein
MIIRMIPIGQVEALRSQLKAQGHRVRVRYRGPHGYCEDTRKANARAATLYVL